MKGGSVGPAARVGCWGFSAGLLVLIPILSTSSDLGPDFDTSRTFFSAGFWSAALDVWVFRAGLCVACVCWCSRVELGGSRLHWSLLLFGLKGSWESCELLWRTEDLAVSSASHCGFYILTNKLTSCRDDVEMRRLIDSHVAQACSELA